MERMGSWAFVIYLAWMGAGGNTTGKKDNRALDNDFLIKVATSSQAEIDYGKLADSRASADVKDFADTLVKDHRALYDQMAELLKTRKVGVIAGTEKEVK